MQRTKASQSFTSTCALSLSQRAKSSGGDKYIATWSSVDNDKDRAIYVPQAYSRFTPGTPADTLSILVQTEEPDELDMDMGWIVFTLVKRAKGSGDDRYTAAEEEAWKGDIYLPKEFRGRGQGKVWLRFNEGEE